MVDPDALPVLVTRTKIMKVEVTFKPDGRLAPPPKSSLSRSRGAAAAPAASAAAAPAAGTRMESVEVLETDNPMAFLLEIAQSADAPSASASDAATLVAGSAAPVVEADRMGAA
eukprot:SAG11_NODE_16225_length_554_cov_0.679121_1_plen_113_part_01